MPSIAIIGASNDRTKFGNKAVRAYNHRGWIVFPVNLHEKSIEHIPAYKSVLDIETVPNAASLYVPPAAVLGVLYQLAQKNIPLVYFNPGTESPDARRPGAGVQSPRQGLTAGPPRTNPSAGFRVLDPSTATARK